MRLQARFGPFYEGNKLKAPPFFMEINLIHFICQNQYACMQLLPGSDNESKHPEA